MNVVRTEDERMMNFHKCLTSAYTKRIAAKSDVHRENMVG